MATNKITVIIDTVVDRANASVKSFRQAIGEADTASGKFKAAGTQALTAVKANAAELAMAGGAALAAFGAKAVGAFQDLALESSKFSDATQMNVEQASRWIEVAGDIGVGVDQIESAFVRMEKAAASGSGAFAEYNVEIARTADGQVDVTQTFLNTLTAIQKIPDANKRAEASSAIFGRGYAEIAELINTDAESILESLNSVSDAKVIDEAEVEKAKRLRAAMDSLQDALDDITLLVGEHLVPVVAEGAEQLAALAEGAEQVKRAFDFLPDPVERAASKIALYPAALSKAIEWQIKAPISAAKAVAGWFGVGESAKVAAEATEEWSFSALMGERQTRALELAQKALAVAQGEQIAVTEENAAKALGFVDVFKRVAGGVREQAQAFLDSVRLQQEATAAGVQAAQEFRDNFNASMQSAGDSIWSFTDKANESWEKLRDQLSVNIVEAQAWQGHLVAIAQETSPAFAQELAKLGPAYLDAVAEMRATDGAVQEAFGLFTEGAKIMTRDVSAELTGGLPGAATAGSKAFRAAMGNEAKLHSALAYKQGREAADAQLRGYIDAFNARLPDALATTRNGAQQINNAMRVGFGLGSIGGKR